MQIKIKKLHPQAEIPKYHTEDSAGVDIAAAIDEPIVIKPLERKLVPAGFAIEIPKGYEIQIRARSGLSLKHGITAANGVGTVDADFRGEICAILVNLSNQDFTVEPGMRVAQMVLSKFETIEWNEIDTLGDTTRGKSGYGSTGH
ncbi:MAG: dUTP diphosphatase [Candidatus Saccharibacteria bacterium]|nr:dUTP diphosphatase [Candidatus Saccharibacteria bacterium]